ncbi:hypothetical protein TeGR_g15020 [Tetraparma gracilis]|uniref:inositol-1,3,4-trisphosphate 5/6-kinase n=1 Tax=Tetraparma gracilis TaxID=2962635 RepID=A0ABQ6MP97_9STRA|nr:hypothetical protein TeGR_g15020 [Tetraparma gracilis]
MLPSCPSLLFLPLPSCPRRPDIILHKCTEALLSNDPSHVVRDIESLAALGTAVVDPPSAVRNVMDRSLIRDRLQRCLPGLTLPGGGAAAAPPSVVCRSQAELRELPGAAGLGYPLLAKNLPAAGTPASHHMSLVFSPSGLATLSPPMLLQSYVNHDGVLHKAYVLGDVVRVFARPSLPNLTAESAGGLGIWRFDSQRP